MSDPSLEQNAPEHDASIPADAIRCISGLIYQVLRPGTGNERPGPDDVVQVVYRAQTETGQPFETSGDNDTPKTLSMREVMPGLAEALQLMTVGQKMRVWIPPKLASDNLREAQTGTLIYDLALVDFTRMKEYPVLPIELTSPQKEE
jgi:FKBP-type peptidyl-prolyl cis-trans isomerase